MSWDVKRCQEMPRDAKRCQESAVGGSQLTTDSQQDPSLLTETWTHNIAGLQWRQMGREGLETATSYKQVTSSSFSPRAGKPFSTFSLCSLCLVFIIVSYSERTMTCSKGSKGASWTYLHSEFAFLCNFQFFSCISDPTFTISCTFCTWLCETSCFGDGSWG